MDWQSLPESRNVERRIRTPLSDWLVGLMEYMPDPNAVLRELGGGTEDQRHISEESGELNTLREALGYRSIPGKRVRRRRTPVPPKYPEWFERGREAPWPEIEAETQTTNILRGLGWSQ